MSKPKKSAWNTIEVSLGILVGYLIMGGLFILLRGWTIEEAFGHVNIIALVASIILSLLLYRYSKK